MKTIHVPIENHSYDVYIESNLLDNISSYVTTKNKKVVIITDSLVPLDHVNKVAANLKATEIITFTKGEKHKTFDTVQMIISKLQQLHISRTDLLVAVGGGIVGDVTGFVASIYLRGMDFIQVPTTLLSMVDSSVGGKVGINTPYAKNSVGAFKQPLVVIIDPTTLDTLEPRQFNNGMAELIKHAIIKDKDLFNDLLQHDFSKHKEEFIFRSVAIKRDVVLQDVEDKGIRHILNFGHTIGHAIEMASNHEVLHGESISIAMSLITKKHPAHQKIIKLFTKYHLPTTTNYKMNSLLKYIKRDKKIFDGKLNFISLKEIGEVTSNKILVDEIINFI